MDRVNVIGTTGSGKTMFGRALAERIGAPSIELDSLYWEAGWRGADPATFRARVDAATSGDRWVVDGGYGIVRDLLWSRADTVVWLDFGFWLVFWRTLRRTVGRILTGDEMWNSGNRESFRNTFLSRKSLLWWVITTYRGRRRRYETLVRDPRYAHLRFLRFRSQSEADRWLGTAGKPLAIAREKG